MIAFSFYPGAATKVAKEFGIGRGADFLFYLSHLVLFFISLIYYLKFRDIELRFSRLVRHIAIAEAKSPNVMRSTVDQTKDS